jgi:hypothetical protein
VTTPRREMPEVGPRSSFSFFVKSIRKRCFTSIWQSRIPLRVDREDLRRDLQRMTRELQSKQGCRGFPADMAERLAIEAALIKRGFLSRQGGRC